MSFRRVILHVILWAGIFTLWLVLTRRHHPTWIVAASATAVLVSAFALAVYVNALTLIPKFAKRRRWLRYLLSLLALILLLDLTAVILIQLIYDWLWRADDEGRYSFWFNMATDGAGIIVHVLAAMALMWAAKRFRKNSTRQPIIASLGVEEVACMSEKIEKHPLNVAGRYYVDCKTCIDHALCVETAPDNFKQDEAYIAYVFKQPDNPGEEAQCRRAMDGCPVLAVRDDG